MSAVLPVSINRATAPSRQRRDLRLVEAEIGEAQDFALAHRNAAENLREIFAKADQRQQRLGLAEAAFAAQARGIGGHFADRLDIGGEPGEAMRGALFALDQRGAQPAAFADPRAHAGDGLREQRFDRGEGLARRGSSSVTRSLSVIGAALRRSMRWRWSLLQCVFRPAAGWRSRRPPRSATMPAICRPLSVSPNSSQACAAAVGGTR